MSLTSLVPVAMRFSCTMGVFVCNCDTVSAYCGQAVFLLYLRKQLK